MEDYQYYTILGFLMLIIGQTNEKRAVMFVSALFAMVFFGLALFSIGAKYLG